MRRKLPSRGHAVRKSISQSSLQKANSSQRVDAVQGYPFDQCVNTEDENRLYKVGGNVLLFFSYLFP